MLKVLALYAKGFLFVVCVFLVGCGNGGDKKRRVVVNEPGGDDEAFADVEDIVDGNCNTPGCHDGNGLRSFDASNFKDSAAAARINSSSSPMPPRPRKLAPADKDALLAYLEG